MKFYISNFRVRLLVRGYNKKVSTQGKVFLPLQKTIFYYCVVVGNNNVTETCTPENSLNIITNVQVEVASAADCDFLQEAIESSQEVVIQKIETLNADGAFHSPDNQNYCKEKEIELVLGAIQGKASRYNLTMNEMDELIITSIYAQNFRNCNPNTNHRKNQTRLL